MSVKRAYRYFAAAFATVVVASALMLCLPHSAWAAEESEPNDSFAAADAVRMGRTMYGETVSVKPTGLGPNVQQPDYFKINVPTAGTYKLTYANDTVPGSGGMYGWQDAEYFEVYNPYYEKVTTLNTSETSTKAMSKSLTLQAGTHYIKVYTNWTNNHEYHFKLAPVVSKTAISKVPPGKKAATVKFKKKAGSSKYQVRYSTKSNMKGSKTVTVKKSKNAVKIKKLKANKKYYFQVRVVKTMDGKDFYSSWSAKKTVKVKR